MYIYVSIWHLYMFIFFFRHLSRIYSQSWCLFWANVSRSMVILYIIIIIVWSRILQYQLHCSIHVLYTLDKGCIREMWCQLLATSSHLQLQWIYFSPEGVCFWINLEAIRPVKKESHFPNQHVSGGSRVPGFHLNECSSRHWRQIGPGDYFHPVEHHNCDDKHHGGGETLFWWVLERGCDMFEGVWIRFVFWDLYW